MPGFDIDGGVQTGQNKWNKAEFRRKHRWRVATGGPDEMNAKDWLYLQKCSRPQFKYEEVVFHHDQEQAYLAGKQSWEAITFTFYDVEDGGGGNDVSSKLYDWLTGGSGKSVGNLSDATVKLPSEYKQDLKLELTSGDGDVNETWTLKGAWPTTCNWQDLSYEETGIALCDVTVRFDRAIRT